MIINSIEIIIAITLPVRVMRLVLNSVMSLNEFVWCEGTLSLSRTFILRIVVSNFIDWISLLHNKFLNASTISTKRQRRAFIMYYFFLGPHVETPEYFVNVYRLSLPWGVTKLHVGHLDSRTMALSAGTQTSTYMNAAGSKNIVSPTFTRS